MTVPLKTKNRATIWAGGPTAGYISREKNNLKRYMYPNAQSNTIIFGNQDMGAS